MLIMFISLNRAFHAPAFYKGDQIYYPHSTARNGEERRGAHRAEWGLRREELIMSLDLRLWTRHQDLGDRS